MKFKSIKRLKCLSPRREYQRVVRVCLLFRGPLLRFEIRGARPQLRPSSVCRRAPVPLGSPAGRLQCLRRSTPLGPTLAPETGDGRATQLPPFPSTPDPIFRPFSFLVPTLSKFLIYPSRGQRTLLPTPPSLNSPNPPWEKIDWNTKCRRVFKCIMFPHLHLEFLFLLLSCRV